MKKSGYPDVSRRLPCIHGITLIVISVLACAALDAQEAAGAGGMPGLEGIAERGLLEQRIGFYDKYNNLMPLLIEELKTCAMKVSGTGEVLATSPRLVIDYGLDLQAGVWEDADRVTLHNEKYWKAILVLTQRDNTALFTRLVLLMREGFLKRAEMVTLFCAYDMNTSGDRDRLVLQMVTNDIKAVVGRSEQCIRDGIAAWDAGRRSEAIDGYHKAMAIYPKSPWALYEISLDRFKFELLPQNKLNFENEPYYRAIRFFDPLYLIAYQGAMTPEIRKAATAAHEKVLPAYQKLRKREDTLLSMRDFADGLFDMQEYELAAYAYKYLLYATYNGGFNGELVGRISDCLRAVGVSQVADFLAGFLEALDAYLKSGTQ
jgi:hypothetical protein